MSMKLRGIAVFVALTLALVFCSASWGQVLKGSISGTVTDPQGAVVSGATVKATSADTGAVYTTTSDSSGLFRFNLIPAGTYKVETTYQGFKTSVNSNVAVTAGTDRDLGQVKLAIGTAADVYEVTAAAPLIETTTAQVTNNFGKVELQTFAGVQENQGLDNLALFVPGIVSVRDNSFSNTNGGAGFSSNGLRGRNNDQEIDGQNNNDNSVGGPGLFVSDVEFVQQYVLVTNQFGPEYGRNAGSVVNIITKSGTNAWHGSIYGSENNSILNSLSNSDKQFNGLTKPSRLNDEFGGFTIGGPWVKNKLFFFGGFDQEIFSTKSVFHSDALTPTPAGLAQLNGCFPASQSLAAFNKIGPFAISGGNPIATKETDPTGGPDFFPLVNVGTCLNVPFGGVTRVLSAPFHGFNFTNRVDWQLGGDTVMARYLFNRGNTFNLDFGDAAAGYPVNVPALSQAILVGWTHNFTSHMVNEARIGFSRLNVDFGGNSLGTLPTAAGVDQAVTRITFNQPGVTNMAYGAATNLPQSRIVNTWQAQDNWNYVLGKHSLKAGVNFTFQRTPNIFLPLIDGSFRFRNWTNFMNNTPNRVQLANGNPSLDFREKDTFLYGGDDWKIGQHLTLNLGLTWTYYGQPANLFHQISAPREANPATALWATTASATTTAGSAIIGQPISADVRSFPIFPAPKNSFGPSLGFAYSPQWGGFLTGHGKTTIRGGYRFLYDPPFYNIYINMSSSAPEVFLQNLPSPATKPLPSTATGPVVRSTYSSFLTPGIFDPRQFNDTTMSPNFGPDKVHSYSFGFEREITKNSVVEVRYAGNRAYHLFQSVNGNPDVSGLMAVNPALVPAGITPCPAANAWTTAAIGREFCDKGITRTRTNGGFSRYNALQTEFRANNLFKQLTVRSAYTWSKNLDNVSEIFSTFGGGNTTTWAQNPFNTGRGDYSFSGLDIPHQWTILFTEQLPFFKEQHGLVGHVLGGWALSANYILASGQRYTPVQAVSAFLTNCFSDFITGAAPTNPFDAITGGGTSPAAIHSGCGGGFLGSFVGFDTARPFLGNLSAPQTSVGMYAGDACFLFSFSGTDPLCTGNPSQLISLTAVGKSGCETNSLVDCPFVAVTKDQVRFIANTAIAQSVFGTPFGNMPRNLPVDAISNFASFAVSKKFKISEKTSFEFRMTMQNVFNHPNFASVDPFLEDAGLHTSGTGFGDPTVTNSTFVGSNNGTRRINFGGTFRF